MSQLNFGMILFPPMFEIGNDGKKDQRCRFVDSHNGRYSNWLIDYLGDKSEPINCTIKSYDSVGSLNRTTGNYSGIVGGIQFGEIDVSTMPIYYPSEGNEDYFDYSLPVYEDTITMMSVYEAITEEIPNDLLFMFDTIPNLLWLGLFLSFLVFARLLDLGNHVLGKTRMPNSWWTVFRAYLNDDNFVWDSPFYVIYAFFASITIFFAMGFMMNSVSTDLVVVDEPSTFSRYQQILDEPKIKVILSPITPDYVKFALALPESMHGKLFKQVVEYDTKEEFVALWGPFSKRESVMIGREADMKLKGLTYLRMVGSMKPKMRLLIATDEQHVKSYTSAFPKNKRISKMLKKKMDKFDYILIESGIALHGYDAVPEVLTEAFTGGPLTHDDREKLSFKVETAEEKYYDVQFKNIKYLIAAITSCLISPVVVFILELLSKNRLGKYLKKLKISIPKISLSRIIQSVLCYLLRLHIKFNFKKNKVKPSVNTNNMDFKVTVKRRRRTAMTR